MLEILSWSSETDPIIKSIMESSNNATYLSHQIQNELLEIMANQIRRKIAEKVSVIPCSDHGNNGCNYIIMQPK